MAGKTGKNNTPKHFKTHIDRDRRLSREANQVAVDAKFEESLRKQRAHSWRTHDGQWTFYVQNKLKMMPEGVQRDQLERMLAVMEDRAIKLLCHLDIDDLGRMSDQSWLRPIEKWKPRGKSSHSIVHSMLSHLYCEYPLPPFLFEVFETKAMKLIQLFAHLGRGGSLIKAVDDEIMPARLTRKMCHEFMQTKSGVGIMPAIRFAQIKCLGGDKSFGEVLATTSWGREFYAENFVLEVLTWFSGQGMIARNHIGQIVDYLITQHHGNAKFSMKGRTGLSVLKAVREWHNELRQGRYTTSEFAAAVFQPSGLGRMREERQTKLKTGATINTVWLVEEILTGKDLIAEGRQQHHCVASYAPRIVQGTTSIWRMETIESGTRSAALTIEVDTRNARVVQARGKLNRESNRIEREILMLWANRNKLGCRF